MTELAADVRPGRRGRGDDRRDQLLPRVRVRPDRGERADPRLDVRCGDRRASRGAAAADHRRLSSMVYESATVFPTPEGAELTSPPPVSTYGFQKLASEYFAHGRVRAVPAAVHDRPAVQLRRDRRAAGAARHGHHVRQRQARPVARRPGPRPQGPQGPGPAPHPRRRVAGPPLHVRRRPRARHPAGDGVGRGGQQRLQPLDRAVDDGARARRGDLAQGPRRRAARSTSSPTRRSSTTSSSASPTSARRARCSGSRRRRPRRRCSTRSSPGSATRSRRAACDRALGRRARVQGRGGGRARPARAGRRHRDLARDPRRLRLRRGPHGAGHRSPATRSCPRSAACATTSGAACSMR